jgi:hypothetical protein
MKAVFFVGGDKYAEAKNKVYADDLVARQSIVIKDCSSLGVKKEGYYIQIDGDEHALKHAEKLLHGTAEMLKGKDAEKVNATIEEQESSAAEGFGAIFG